MAIKFTVGEEANKPDVPPVKISLKINKLLNNDYYISSHSLVDIIVQRGDGKILALPKEEITDQVYGVQDRLFDFLGKRGVVDIATIRSGNIYGGIEAEILGPDAAQSEQASLLALKQWLDEEKPLETLERDMEREQELNLLLPDDDESTELGDVPHYRTKGTMQQTGLGSAGGSYFFESKEKGDK